MKILIINQGWTDNLGDNAIAEVLEIALKSYSVKTVPFAAQRPNKRSGIGKLLSLYELDRANKKQFTEMVSLEQLNLKAIIIGGGELFAGNMSFNSAFVSWVKVCKKNKIPIFVYGVSGNKLNQLYSIRIKKALGKCSYIAVRDQKTRQLFKDEYNICPDYYPDAVFAYSRLERPVKLNVNMNKKTILCNPLDISYFRQETQKDICLDAYLQIWTDLILDNYFEDCLIIVGSTTVEDSSTSRLLVEYINNKHPYWDVKLHLANSLEEYWEMLNEVNCVISARMHAMILAVQRGCRCVPVCFKEKLVEFEKEYHDYLSGKLPIDPVLLQAEVGLEKLSLKLSNIK